MPNPITIIRVIIPATQINPKSVLLNNGTVLQLNNGQPLIFN